MLKAAWADTQANMWTHRWTWTWVLSDPCMRDRLTNRLSGTEAYEQPTRQTYTDQPIQRQTIRPPDRPVLTNQDKDHQTDLYRPLNTDHQTVLYRPTGTKTNR